MNAALRHILHFDLNALAPDFELYGQRDQTGWTLILVPRVAARQRSIGRIAVAGESATIRRIEFRRSAGQGVTITIAPPHPAAVFTPEELRRYFR